MGAGTMGLVLQLLNRGGARSVTVVDRKAARLTAATAVGAAGVADDSSGLEGRTFGVAVDATGAPAAIEAAFQSLERGGRLLVFGVTSGDATVSLSPFRIYNDEPHRNPTSPHPGGDPHRNPTDETALCGTLAMPVKGTEYGR